MNHLEIESAFANLKDLVTNTLGSGSLPSDKFLVNELLMAIDSLQTACETIWRMSQDSRRERSKWERQHGIELEKRQEIATQLDKALDALNSIAVTTHADLSLSLTEDLPGHVEVIFELDAAAAEIEALAVPVNVVITAKGMGYLRGDKV